MITVWVCGFYLHRRALRLCAHCHMEQIADSTIIAFPNEAKAGFMSFDFDWDKSNPPSLKVWMGQYKNLVQ